MGFWLQKEPLRAGAAFAWSKPRLLLELLPRVSWEYVLVVDADALPLQYSRSWEYLVKRHMRHRRYANDDTDRRHIFCPENCEEGSTKHKRREDACSGALLSGCIFWSEQARTHEIVDDWYAKREDEAVVASADDG